MSEQTRAQQAEAAAAQARTVPQAAPVPPAPAKQMAEQRMSELDKLAAGGYITPEPGKKMKQAIIDGM